MDEALQLMIQMNEGIWHRFKDGLGDVTPEEIDWQPLPHANTIDAILRHLRIEAQWHLASLEHGAQSPGGSSRTTPPFPDNCEPMPIGHIWKSQTRVARSGACTW